MGPDADYPGQGHAQRRSSGWSLHHRRFWVLLLFSSADVLPENALP